MEESTSPDSGQPSVSELSAQVERLSDELEAARIERDQYRAATQIMSQALQQMDDLLHGSSGQPGPSEG